MLSIEYYSVSVANNLFQYVPDVTKIFKEVILSAWVTKSARPLAITMFLLPAYTHAKQFSQLMLLTEKWFFHTNAQYHKLL